MKVVREYGDYNGKLYDLAMQEKIVNNTMYIKALLYILVDKNIITAEEIDKYVEEAKNSEKYKSEKEDIQKQLKEIREETEMYGDLIKSFQAYNN